MSTVARTSLLPRRAMPSVTLRFLWKEYRTLRGLWLAVLVLAVLAMAMAAALLNANDLVPALLTVAFGSAALFAAGAPVLLFAKEHEEGTTRFLGSIPNRQATAFLGKLLAAVLSTLAMLLATCLLVVCFHRALPAQSQFLSIAEQGLVFIAEAFAWGMLTSLICRQALVAGVLGIALASFSSQVAISLAVPRGMGFDLDDFQRAIPTRLAIVGLVAAVDGLLGIRWMRLAPQWWARRRHLADTMDESRAARPIKAKRRGALVRLLWQTVREAWTPMLMCFAVALFLAIAVEILAGFVVAPLLLPGRQYVVPVSLFFVPALFGAMVFSGDQRQYRYRFLAEHAARPRLVWLARQAVWFVPVLLWCLMIQLIINTVTQRWLLQSLSQDRFYPRTMESIQWLDSTVQIIHSLFLHASWLFWAGSIAAFAIGQLCSLVWRSSILAALFSLSGSILILAWCYLAAIWGLSATWFVLPIAIAAWLASFLRVPDWLFERQAIARLLAPTVALLLPLALVGYAVPRVRLAQVAAPYPAQYVDTQALAELIENAKQRHGAGRKLADAYRVLADEIDYERFTAPANVAERLIALSREHAALPGSFVEYRAPDSNVLNHLTTYAEHEVKRRQRAGELESALELLLALRRMKAQVQLGQTSVEQRGYYSTFYDRPNRALLRDWATSAGQTRELLTKAIAGLEEIGHLIPTPAITVSNDYLHTQAVMRQDAVVPPSRWYDKNWHRVANLLHQIRGEEARAQVALDHLAMYELDYATAVMDDALGKSHVGEQAPRASMLRRLLNRWGAGLLPPPQTFEQATHAEMRAKNVIQAATSYLVLVDFFLPDELRLNSSYWVYEVALRRAERIRLAMIAYHLQHGEYPAELAALAPDWIAADDLVDPFSGALFEYLHEGFALPLFDRAEGEEVKPHTPVLWSVGLDNVAPREEDLVFEQLESGERRVINRAAGRALEDNWTVERGIVLDSLTHDVWWVVSPLVIALPTDLPRSEPAATPGVEPRE